MILTLALLVLYRLLAKKIDYAFEYSWDFDDHHFVLNRSDEAFQKLLNQMTHSSYADHQIILAEDGSDAYGLALDRLDEVESPPEEVVILVKNKETSRNGLTGPLNWLIIIKVIKSYSHIID